MGEQAGGGLTVAVLGSVDQADAPALRRVVHHTSSALAVALDVDAWSGPHAPPGGATPFLARSGWRSVTLRPRDRLDSVWEELGRTTSLRSGRMAASS